mmetsp:Transcript_21259/g.70528  ORF Transcript_21259/g.70528 Transcript_21259/m.70528 type:complete len:229 (-) Transcript_21259:320-1006(-)
MQAALVKDWTSKPRKPSALLRARSTHGDGRGRETARLLLLHLLRLLRVTGEEFELVAASSFSRQRVGESNDIGEIHAEMAGAQSAACQGDGVEVEEKLPSAAAEEEEVVHKGGWLSGEDADGGGVRNKLAVSAEDALSSYHPLQEELGLLRGHMRLLPLHHLLVQHSCLVLHAEVNLDHVREVVDHAAAPFLLHPAQLVHDLLRLLPLDGPVLLLSEQNVEDQLWGDG